MVRGGVHKGGFVFAGLAAALLAHGLAGNVAGVPVQPAAEHDLPGQVRRLASQIGENRLGDILGQVEVPVDQSARGRVHQVHIARHQLPEGLFRPAFGILSQELLTLGHLLS